MQLALVTSGQFASLTEDDAHLLSVLRRRDDIQTQVVIWNDKSVDWAQFVLVLIRTPW